MTPRDTHPRAATKVSTRLRTLAVLVVALAVAGVSIVGRTVPATADGSVGEASMSLASASSQRVSGADRYATSVEVARQVGGGSLTGLDRLIIATGERFPDGLTASGLAGYLDEGGRSGRTAILLTRTASLPSVVADAIRASGVPASEVFVVGGPAAVSAEVFAGVADAAGWDGAGVNPVTRIAGANRYETASAIVEFVKQKAGGTLPGSYRTVLVANGQDFPDALVGGTLAYRNGHLILLSPPPAAPQVSLGAVDALAANCAVVLGGTAALAARVAGQVGDRLVPGGCGVDRVGGADRFETATLIASRFQNVNGRNSQVVLASGVEFADALTAAPLAGGNRPVVFTAADRLPAATAAWLGAHGSVSSILVIGGSVAVGSGVVDEAVTAATPAPAPSPGPGTTVPGPGGPAAQGWATRAGSDTTDRGYGVSVVLADGSAIVTGQFGETATFGATTLTSAGESDVFVAKINADGTWAWATRAGGSGEDIGRSVSVVPSADGSAIVTGEFEGTANFPGPGGSNTLTSAGGKDVFVAAINANGSWAWATSAGGNTTTPDTFIGDIGYGVSALADGSAIVTGNFFGSAAFGGTTLTSAGGLDVFVAKTNPNGTWAWATSAGGPNTDSNDPDIGDIGFGVSALADGSAIVTGEFHGTATFGATTVTSAGFADVFVAKIDANGTWVRATSAGGNANDIGRSVSVVPSALADGSVIVTGQFQQTATFGATTPLTSPGSADVFVAKVKADGTWEWATRAGGTAVDNGYSVSALADGSAIVTGRFQGTATFGATTPLTSPGASDVYVAKIDASGTWVWATRAGGTDSDRGWGVSALADGSAILTGDFGGTAAFGTTTLVSVSAADDLFVAKINANGSFG
jgi:putative cell wall-binding protein